MGPGIAKQGEGSPAPLAPPPGARIAVAGGCGGFGRALVEECLLHQHRVAVLDLPASIESHPPGEAVELVVPLDATREASVAAAFANLGQAWETIDALVFLIGFTTIPPTRLAEVDAAAWDEIQAGNLRSAHLVTRAAMPLLDRSESAAIVTVSSALAYALLPGFAPYGAAKAGLVALTKALAVEHAPRVRANAVAPTASPTAFVAGGTGRGGEEADLDWFDAEAHAKTFPLGRLCEPRDVVGPILFLAGPGSSFITGQVLHVNGGKLTP